MQMSELLSLPLAVQTTDFLYAVLLGAIFGVYYDGLRCLRWLCKHKRWWKTALLDLLFVVGVVAAVFVFATACIGGRLRIWEYVGMASGGWLYFWTLSGWVYSLFAAVINLVIWIIVHIFGGAYIIIQRIGHKIVECMKKMYKVNKKL